jgi:hypothetical protein
LSNVGSGGGAPAAGSAAPAVSSGAAAVVEKQEEEKKEEKEEESDDDMVRTLFNFQCLQVLLIFFLHFIGFRTFRLIYFTTYDFLGEFVTSLVRCGVSYEGACSHSMPNLLTQNKMDLEREYVANMHVLNSESLGYLHTTKSNVIRDKLSGNCVLSIVLL